MAIKKPIKKRKAVVNLDGPDGNAFVLLGFARGWSKDTGEDWEAVKKEAMSGDYKHLVQTLEKYFGRYVDFETNQKDLLK